MAKGTAIKLSYGASIDDVVGSVREKYAEQRATAKGWHGTAVVNVEANADGKDAKTYLVQGTKDGFRVFGFIGAVTDKIQVKTGKFVPAE